MSRKITSHIVNPANDQISITVTDEPGPGGANHRYEVSWPDIGLCPVVLNFQNGAINEVGVNGITHEVLLAILIDRMQGFQNGPYKNRENAVALTKMEEAVMWLAKRTRDRMARGVEGTMTV